MSAHEGDVVRHVQSLCNIGTVRFLRIAAALRMPTRCEHYLGTEKWQTLTSSSIQQRIGGAIARASSSQLQPHSCRVKPGPRLVPRMAHDPPLMRQIFCC